MGVKKNKKTAAPKREQLKKRITAIEAFESLSRIKYSSKKEKKRSCVISKSPFWGQERLEIIFNKEKITAQKIR